MTGRIGDCSFDAKAGSIDGMFALTPVGGTPHRKLILDPSTGNRPGH